jgi:hypothetical protein
MLELSVRPNPDTPLNVENHTTTKKDTSPNPKARQGKRI